MVKIYNESSPGRTKVFFVVRDGRVSRVITGNHAVSTEQGLQFYVDDYVADQIYKCELYIDGLEPKLIVKEGETIEVPEKSEKEKEIERLKFELEKLQNEDKNAK